MQMPPARGCRHEDIVGFMTDFERVQFQVGIGEFAVIASAVTVRWLTTVQLEFGAVAAGP